MLQVKGSCRLSLPVLRDNLSRVLRGAGGGAGGAGLGSVVLDSVVHISSAEDAPDNDSELVSDLNAVILVYCYIVTLYTYLLYCYLFWS